MDNDFFLSSEIDIENLNKIIIPVINENFDSELKTIRRFPTGSCHFVYDAILKSEKNIVFRIGYFLSNKSKIVGSIFWYEQMKALGIKVPELLYSDVSCDKYPKPFTVSERLEGDDIGNMIDTLSDESLNSIAKEIVAIQNKISSLGAGAGFGEMTNYENGDLKESWKDFLYEKIDRIKTNLTKANVFDVSYITKIEKIVNDNSAYFDKVKPVPFFDDITSKNIIIDNNGNFSGVVDFDTMTFGDRLYWLGLTNMAFIFLDRIFYIECLSKYLKLTEEDLRIMNLYTIIFCVDFMSEVGHKFNKDEAIIDENKIKKFKEIFKGIYSDLSKKN